MRTLPGTSYHPPAAELSQELHALVERCAFQYGKTYDSYLALDPDRHLFVGTYGIVPFLTIGPFVHVIGGVLAAPGRTAHLLGEFLEFSQLNRRHPSVFNVVDEDVPAYEECGFQVTKIGEEPIIPVDRCDWRGKPYEWVRRQENYCLRAGLVTREIDHRADFESYRRDIVPQIEEINRQYVRSTVYRRELGAFMGRFRPLQLERRRLFVAEREGRIDAFVIANPYNGGDGWAMEMYRSKPDATRGIIPYMTLQIARQLTREGVQGLSLSLLPCLRCETPRPGDSPLVRTLSSLSWIYFTRIYNFQGLYHFKSRFRPEFRNTYVASAPRMTFCAMYTAMHLWGIYRPHPLAVPALLWKRVRDSWSHRLATPETPELAPVPTAASPLPAPRKKDKVLAGE